MALTPVTAQPVPWRAALAPVASVAYVAALAVGVDGAHEPRTWLVGAGAIALALSTSRRQSAPIRWVGWGFAVLAASLATAREGRALHVFGALGVFACAAAACVGVRRIPGDGGLAEGVRPSPALAIVCVAIAWLAACASAYAPAAGFLGAVALPAAPSWLAMAVTVVGVGVFTEWTARRRTLELGVTARIDAMRAGLLALFFAASLVAAFGQARTYAVGLLAIASGLALVTVASVVRDPIRIARASRRIAVLVIASGGVALLGASAAEGSGDVWTWTLAAGLLCAAVGSAARGLEAPLRPARGAWLDAFDRAYESSNRPEPEDAIREVLMALRAPGGLSGPSPELWTLAPSRVATVDAAGYLHEQEAELPEALLLFAAAEPEATLRTEVLEACEVRRAELRPLARWMTGRDAMLATVVACEGETEGLLVLPRAKRGESPTLEELRALKGVADHLAGACRARSGQLRMLERGRNADARAADAEQRLRRVLHERALDAGRDALAAVRLARPATIGVYSASSRFAFEQLEQRTAADVPFAVVAPSGVDPVPYIARAHLGGARRSAPLVLVDGTSAREHDVERWTDPSTSPLALSHRGLLVLLDAAGLPPDVQQLIARACSERRAPWDRADAIDVQIAVTGVAPPDRFVAEGRLDAALALRLGEARFAPIVLPRLRDRPEDLRAILTDRLAREGLRALGRPVGIEQAAFARLVNHPFPGEDAELAAIVQRLVARSTGDVVRAADVEALRLVPPEDGRRKDPLSA